MSDEYQSMILGTSIQKLGFSKDFKEKTELMGFQTLLEITQTEPDVLLQNECFDYNWFGELVKFLIDKKLLYLLQPTPGNNPG
jgi:hypothetical protein